MIEMKIGDKPRKCDVQTHKGDIIKVYYWCWVRSPSLITIYFSCCSISNKKRTIGEDPLAERRKIKALSHQNRFKEFTTYRRKVPGCLKLGRVLTVVPNPYLTTSSPSVR
ncbi:unnamed protein product [Brassica rapa]|uniref:Uncharacterized protein n=1 Tax=Brassica campestris TaxID=3711 RepID=A0A8D9M0R1_BRACM|nr:unnamed protein product [Brassica rapa]